jgi:uncharacterized protein YutE (UPF0331/DUF86 family)
MVNRDLVAAKLTELAHRVQRVKDRCPETPKQLAADADALEIVSFNLMLAVQTCADIASHIISDEGWPAARTLAEGFQRLRDHGALSAETAESLCKAVGLRNVVVHGYSGINPSMVHSAATRGVHDLNAFAREVGVFVASQR